MNKLDRDCALRCSICNKHGVFFNCNWTGDHFCPRHWDQHKAKAQHDCSEIG